MSSAAPRISLANRYRPKTLSELVGQEFVVKVLTAAFRQDRIAGAYLLYGSRGTGKTTTARIIAKGVNCLDRDYVQANGMPCGQCDHCRAFDEGRMVDVIEIDAASYTSVDNVREIIDMARFQPTQGRFKVYIIDEVHMLSTGAFNALLKTLEEPPEHVRFILATTELEKVPDTILSRVHRFDFRRMTEGEIVDRLIYVTQAENIRVEGSALQLIARLSGGAMRDGLTLLEQFTSDGSVSAHVIEERLGLIPMERVEECLDLLTDGSREALTIVDSVIASGTQVGAFLEDSIRLLRDRMRESVGSPAFARISTLMTLASEAYRSRKLLPDPTLALEIFAYRAIDSATTAPLESPPEKKAPTKSIHSPEQSTILTKKAPAPLVQTTQEEIPSAKMPSGGIVISTPSDEGSASTEALKEFSVAQFISNVEKTDAKKFLIMSLKLCKFTLQGSVLTVEAPNDFHRQKIDTPSARQILTEVLTTFVGAGASLIIAIGTPSISDP